MRMEGEGAMETPKERFERMIKEYEQSRKLLPEKYRFFFGERLKAMDNPVGRKIVADVSTKAMASLIVNFKLFGVEKRPGMSIEEIALNWLKPSIVFRIPAEVGEVSEDSVEIFRPECTVGFKDPKLCKICRASMNMDMEIVRLLGGKLTVTETILEGAQRCRHIIVKA
jgi:hypothetical protein